MEFLWNATWIFGLPWLAGSALWVALTGRPKRAYDFGVVLGYGYFLGALLTAAMTWLLVLQQQHNSRFLIILGLLLITGLSLVRDWRRTPVAQTRKSRVQKTWQKVLWWCLALWLAFRLGSLGFEIIHRPLFPWDAWAAWAVKSMAWYGTQEIVPFASLGVWLESADPSIYTNYAWHYPPFIPALQLWVSQGLGVWHEPIMGLSWLLALLAICMAMYGQLRAIGLAPLAAAGAAVVFATLPIANAHAALAGYGDIWVAGFHGLAALALFRSVLCKSNRYYWVSLGMAVGMILVKLEGAIWILTFLPALLFARVNAKTRNILLVAAVLVLAVWWMLGGFTVWLPYVGFITISPDLITIPQVGEFELGYRNTWLAVAQVLFVGPNWHLLWYAAIVIVVFRARAIFAGPALSAASILVMGGMAFLFLLFFFTNASQWADNFTSTNRLVLHMVPALIGWLTLLLFFAPAYSRNETTRPELSEDNHE